VATQPRAPERPAPFTFETQIQREEHTVPDPTEHPPGADFDPFNGGATIAEVPGFRALRVELASDAQLAWRVSPCATTTVFACRVGVAVELKRPAFRCVLKAGEFYSIPPNADWTLHGPRGVAGEVVIFQYGEALESICVDPPDAPAQYERSASPASNLIETPIDCAEDLGLYSLGLNRLEVLACPPNLRLLIQGHGPYECAPWHSHDAITDTFFCVEGRAQIVTRTAAERHLLLPGDSFEVGRGVPHLVSGVDGASCLLLVLQGVGIYNNVLQDPS